MFYSSVICIVDNFGLSVNHISDISSSSLSLSNAFLIPKFSLDMISVGQLCDIGLEVHFSHYDCSVQDLQTRQICRIGHKVGYLFELTSLHLSSQITSNVSKYV